MPRDIEMTVPDSTSEWVHIRQASIRSMLSDWEQDTMFLEFALIHWPREMAAACRGGYKGQAPRQRLRHRHECFALLWTTLAPEQKHGS